MDKIIHFSISTNDVDIMNISEHEKCPFRDYEKSRLSSLKQHVDKGIKILERNFTNLSECEKNKMTELNPLDQTLSNAPKSYLLCDLITDIKVYHQDIIIKCDAVRSKTDEFQLPPLRPSVMEQTDAGSGVGVSNKQVQFRAAE